MLAEWPALRYGVAVVQAADEESAPLHPVAADYLGRAAQIGPNFWRSTEGSRSLLSDLRVSRLRDPLDSLRAVLIERRDLIRERTDVADGTLMALLHAVNRPMPAGERARLEPSACKLALTDPEQLHQVLSCYVDCFAGWEDAEAIVRAVADTLLDTAPTEETAHLLMACGSVEGSAGRRSAEEFFTTAERGLIEPWDRFFLHLRWATVALKRFDDRAVFGDQLSAAGEAVAELDEFVGGRHFANALTTNLLALAALRVRDIAEARRLAGEAAESILECETPRAITKRMAARYRSTLMINVAVASGLGGDWADAAGRLETLLVAVTDSDVDSVSEVLSLAGLAWVRAASDG